MSINLRNVSQQQSSDKDISHNNIDFFFSVFLDDNVQHFTDMSYRNVCLVCDYQTFLRDKVNRPKNIVMPKTGECVDIQADYLTDADQELGTMYEVGCIHENAAPYQCWPLLPSLWDARQCRNTYAILPD